MQRRLSSARVWKRERSQAALGWTGGWHRAAPPGREPGDPTPGGVARARAGPPDDRTRPPPRAAAGAPLPDLLVDVLRDHLERAVGRRRPGLAHDEALPLAVEQLEVDHPARLAVRRDEAVEMRSGVRHILGALQVQHRRQLHLLPAL